MKINIASGISSKLQLINEVIDENIDPDFHTNIQNAIQAVEKIWTRDTIVKNYTSHKLDHNIRVLYYCYELINFTGIKLDKTGYYILTMAALLHDFGMQCYDKSIIQSFCPKEIRMDDEKKVSNVVRKYHAKICVKWMTKLYKDSTSECGRLISLINPRLMNPICDVIKYHSGDELYDVRENLTYFHNNVECKLMPIILLLRLADELDIGCERSDNDMSLRADLKDENLSYFWLHYITQISFVTDNIIRITIETHSVDKDKQDFFKNIIYDSFLEKNKRLLEMFEIHCGVCLSIIYAAKTNDFLDVFNPIIYDYLVSKSIVKDDYFDNIIKITYSVPDIGDVFELDHKLLPMIYKEKDCYAVTKEQSYRCANRNSNMTIGAYKHGKIIGYLTLWPITSQLLDSVLNFDLLESEINYERELYTYDESNIKICWYVSGLGISNEERGRRNDPLILQQLIEKALGLAKDILKPKKIIVERIGAIVYSRVAENLCLRHFGMKVVKEADYSIDGYIPKAVCVDVASSSVVFIKELRNILLDY